MASGKYNKYDDFDFSAFEPKQSSFERNAARKLDTAPKRNISYNKKPDMKLIERPRKSLMQAKSEMKHGNARALTILGVAVVLLVMISALLYGRIKVDELDRQIQRKNNELKAAQSENVRLNTTLDSMISLKNVEEYAQNNLGMVKMDNHQIEYIDLSGEDKASVSGEKTVKKESGKKSFLSSKFMEYMSK